MKKLPMIGYGYFLVKHPVRCSSLLGLEGLKRDREEQTLRIVWN